MFPTADLPVPDIGPMPDFAAEGGDEPVHHRVDTVDEDPQDFLGGSRAHLQQQTDDRALPRGVPAQFHHRAHQRLDDPLDQRTAPPGGGLPCGKRPPAAQG